MNDLKLTIDLLPKGAWGQDLSKTLPKKDWDILREFCYEKANNRCEICGRSDTKLNAHEVWDFDIGKKTQTLVDIVALCSACHGVKHYRNSNRIGYGENSKRHFMRVNNCNELTFAGHLMQAENDFEEKNKVLRWKMIVDLKEFGGKDIVFNQKVIPLIVNPYSDVDSFVLEYESCFTSNVSFENVTPNNNLIPPKVRSIEVDNYSGTIKVVADYANRIEWFSDNEHLRTKFNLVGRFATEFTVEN